MPRRCLVLFSGGLDSMLAVRILQAQGIEVEALNFKTIFTCCQDQAGQMARLLDVRLTVISQEDDYLEVIRRPRFGYGKGANPCVDCRIYMFDRARQCMETLGADFLASGEIVGQRPMSQKRRDLDVIAFHSGNEEMLLRPLCAKRLPPTLPEREGWVDREKLYNFLGRGRRPLINLAKKFGITEIPPPSTGCSLTEKQFGRTVLDLVQLSPAAGRWDFEVLKTGRHFRLNSAVKVAVGRNSDENSSLEFMHELPTATSSALLKPRGFKGPTVLILGPADETSIDFAAGMIARYANDPEMHAGQIELRHRNAVQLIAPRENAAAQQATTLAAT